MTPWEEAEREIRDELGDNPPYVLRVFIVFVMLAGGTLQWAILIIPIFFLIGMSPTFQIISVLWACESLRPIVQASVLFWEISKPSK